MAKDKPKTAVTHITPADGNIFLDLGFAPEEAARLLTESDRLIDEKRHKENNDVASNKDTKRPA